MEGSPRGAPGLHPVVPAQSLAQRCFLASIRGKRFQNQALSRLGIFEDHVCSDLIDNTAKLARKLAGEVIVSTADQNWLDKPVQQPCITAGSTSNLIDIRTKLDWEMALLRTR